MSFLHWIVTLSALATVVFAWGVYLSEKLSKHNTPLDEEEERLVELMGKVRVFVDSKIEILDQKLKEVKEAIKQINDSYVDVLAKNIVEREEIERQLTNKPLIEEEKIQLHNEVSENFDEHPTVKKSVEEEIYEMFLNGMDIVEIAREKKMGVGEVSLIIELMKRQGGR